MYSLGELADRLGLAFTGDGHKNITGLASLEGAGPADLTFFSGKKQYAAQLAATRAAAVMLHPGFVEQCPVDCLVADDPYLAFARVSALFDRTPPVTPGVHASAVVSADARLHDSVSVGPHAVVEAGAVLAANVVLGAGVYVGYDTRIGAGSRVHANAVIYREVSLGENCIIHGQAALGADGFGFAEGPTGWEKICQLGSLRIGDGVEIGAGTTVDRGTLDDTIIEDGVIIDNLVQIAHNCRIGKNTAIAGCVGLAGGTIIGANCTLAGGVGVVGHVEICDNVHVTGMTMVTHSIREPGSYSSGTRMASTRDWKRSAVRFSQLEAMQRRLSALERKR